VPNEFPEVSRWFHRQTPGARHGGTWRPPVDHPTATPGSAPSIGFEPRDVIGLEGQHAGELEIVCGKPFEQRIARAAAQGA
jgi:hypothetical protein